MTHIDHTIEVVGTQFYLAGTLDSVLKRYPYREVPLLHTLMHVLPVVNSAKSVKLLMAIFGLLDFISTIYGTNYKRAPLKRG